MVKLSKLYTREGDHGETGLVGGVRVRKTDPQVVAYGNVDELNAWLGVIRSALGDIPSAELASKYSFEQSLAELQQTLFDIGAELATPRDSEWKPPSVVSSKDVTSLEQEIDQWTAQVAELKSFLLPGGSQITSFIHVTRCVCRRTERSIIETAVNIPVRDEVIMYMNRLSDWLFALARIVAKELGEEETLWDTGRMKKN